MPTAHPDRRQHPRKKVYFPEKGVLRPAGYLVPNRGGPKLVPRWKDEGGKRVPDAVLPINPRYLRRMGSDYWYEPPAMPSGSASTLQGTH